MKDTKMIERLMERLAAVDPRREQTIAQLEQFGRELQGIVNVTISDSSTAVAGSGSNSSNVGAQSTAAEGV